MHSSYSNYERIKNNAFSFLSLFAVMRHVVVELFEVAIAEFIVWRFQVNLSYDVYMYIYVHIWLFKLILGLWPFSQTYGKMSTSNIS